MLTLIMTTEVDRVFRIADSVNKNVFSVFFSMSISWLHYRRELEEFSRQQLAALQSKAAEEKCREQEEFARHHHFLISTAVVPGIYNKVCGTSLLFDYIVAFLHSNVICHMSSDWEGNR